MAWDSNIGDSESSVYADDGTASHQWAAIALQGGADASAYIGCFIPLNGVEYEMTEERAAFIQVYLDLVRQWALGAILFVEHRVEISDLTDGTVDAGVILPRRKLVVSIDLKYGVGEKVSASYIKDGKRLPNHQLALYGAGLINDARLLGVEPEGVVLVVCQPRLNHVDEQEFTVAEIEELVGRAKVAQKRALTAIAGNPKNPEIHALMNPADKTCRWCRAKAECPKLAKFVSDQVKKEFAEMNEANEPVVPNSLDELSAAGRALPLIHQWCKAVQTAISEAVTRDVQIIGTDGQPLKFVEGERGDRKWVDEAAAEAALLAVLGPDKAYAPRKLLTAPGAAKILDKKATKAQWIDQFEPMIRRAPGRPVLALGSDPRPRYSNAAGANEFEDIRGG